MLLQLRHSLKHSDVFIAFCPFNASLWTAAMMDVEKGRCDQPRNGTVYRIGTSARRGVIEGVFDALFAASYFTTKHFTVNEGAKIRLSG